MITLSAALLAAALVLRGRNEVPSRLSRLGPAQTQLAARRRPSLPRLACAGAGAALVLLGGGPLSVLLGVLVAVVGPSVLARLEPEDPDADLLAEQLPMALDLLAACLAGGAEIGRAVSAVAEAAPDPVGGRLHRVAVFLALGAAPAEAWGALAAGEGPAAAAARALVRSAEGGAPVAEAVHAVAERARDEARARARTRARRAGVLAVGPLGLCFLPAFLLAGVVPAVLGLAGPLLTTLR